MTELTERQTGRLCVLLIFLFLVFPSATYGQSFGFSAGGGSVPLTLTTATAGAEPNSASDTSTQVTWDADFGVTSKITVSTICIDQDYSLTVELLIISSGSGGNELGPIVLIDGMAETDLLTNIPFTSPARVGTGTLTYVASATVADGNSSDNGDDIHTVTLTLTAQ